MALLSLLPVQYAYVFPINTTTEINARTVTVLIFPSKSVPNAKEFITVAKNAKRRIGSFTKKAAIDTLVLLS